MPDKRVLLWIDASANYERMGSRAEIRRVVTNAKKAGVTTLVLDVKPVNGSVLYRSRIAPFYEKKGYEFSERHDPLAVLIAEAHSLGLEVHASFNIFSEGSNGKGLVYESDNDWATQMYDQALYLETENATVEIVRYNHMPKEGQLAYLTRDMVDKLEINGTAVLVKDNVVKKVLTSGEVSLKDGDVVYGEGSAAELLKDSLGAKIVARAEIRPITEWANASQGFVNPLLPKVQAYELALLEEVASHYQVDGIVLDRVRYHNQNCDFSDITRQLFEEHLGKKVENWPEDIISLSFVNGKKQVEDGPLAKAWYFFRALGIKVFFIKARDRIKELRPDIFFGDYVGSWYPEYYALGVNWASEDYILGYEWAQSGYERTGYAEVLDYLTTGNYYSDVYLKDLEGKVKAKVGMRTEAGQSLEYKPWYSVEGACDMVNEKVLGKIPVYGGLYLLQYQDKPEVFKEAMKVCLEKSDGLMLFDLVYVDMYDWWDNVAEVNSMFW
ncbi:MAG: alpha amylase family protein [Firmicutes bacterium]|nr:alpha amylase family protein [Bacillota bacterium]MDD4262902.1 alpha amylase family protein [Bacillota bacterium]